MHSSHSNDFMKYDVTCGASLICSLLLSHICRHFICTCFIVPEHLQGLNSGFPGSTSDKQILHTLLFRSLLAIEPLLAPSSIPSTSNGLSGSYLIYLNNLFYIRYLTVPALLPTSTSAFLAGFPAALCSTTRILILPSLIKSPSVS